MKPVHVGIALEGTYRMTISDGFSLFELHKQRAGGPGEPCESLSCFTQGFYFDSV